MRLVLLLLVSVVLLFGSSADAQRLVLEPPGLRYPLASARGSLSLPLAELDDRPEIATSALRRQQAHEPTPNAGARWLMIGGVSLVSTAASGYITMLSLGECYDSSRTRA